jgi:hypothetical protein
MTGETIKTISELAVDGYSIIWNYVGIAFALFCMVLGLGYGIIKLWGRDEFDMILAKLMTLVEKAEMSTNKTGKGAEKFAAVANAVLDDNIFSEKEREVIRKKGGVEKVLQAAYNLALPILKSKLKIK